MGQNGDLRLIWTERQPWSLRACSFIHIPHKSQTGLAYLFITDILLLTGKKPARTSNSK